jgi:hypothetical protein
VGIALVVTSTPANAQQVYKATFNLPFEAQVGKAVLEPGATRLPQKNLGDKASSGSMAPASFRFL